MQTYVINLDCRPERMAFMQAQLEQLGMDFTRISAINGLNDDPIATPDGKGKLSGPEVACYRSHLKAYAAFLETGAPFALILEDDMQLAETLPAAISFIKAAKPHKKITRVEIPIQSLTNQPSRVAFRPFARSENFSLIRLLSNVYGMGAYVIDRPIAQRMLDAFSAPETPIDILLLCKNPLMKHRPKVLQLSPPLAIQNRYLGALSHPEINESDLEDARIDEWAQRSRKSGLVVKKKLQSKYYLVRLFKQGLRNITVNLTKIFMFFARPAKKLWSKMPLRYQLFTYEGK